MSKSELPTFNPLYGDCLSLEPTMKSVEETLPGDQGDLPIGPGYHPELDNRDLVKNEEE